MIKLDRQFHERYEAHPFTPEPSKRVNLDVHKYIVNHRGSEPRVNGGYLVRDTESGVKFIATSDDAIRELANYLDRRERRPLYEIERPDLTGFTMKGDWLKCRPDDWCFYVNRNGNDLMVTDNFDDRFNDRMVGFDSIENDILYRRMIRRFHGLRGWNHIIVKI